MRISVVIPAYNEALRLPATLAAVADHLGRDESWIPAEIIVVDDGSTDATGTVVALHEPAEGVALRSLTHPANRGKGAAVRTGVAASLGDLVLLCDADLATPIAELDRLAAVLTDGVAIGSRAVDRLRIERRQPVYRDLMGRCFNLAVRLLATPGIRDTQCGFKLFDGALARALVAAQRVDGFAFDVELLLLARAWGREVREVPVRWAHVDESRVRPITHSAEMLRDLLGIALRRLAGALPSPPLR
ncbi:MAG: glycosyltransferase family 2 protein [Thermoanaerobaculales bacterium]|nr:glycosyltransferase family 2 protein [Thermoanaerobaculales bacterium]